MSAEAMGLSSVAPRAPLLGWAPAHSASTKAGSTAGMTADPMAGASAGQRAETTVFQTAVRSG